MVVFGLASFAPHCFLQLCSPSTVCWVAHCFGSWVMLGVFCLTPCTIKHTSKHATPQGGKVHTYPFSRDPRNNLDIATHSRGTEAYARRFFLPTKSTTSNHQHTQRCSTIARHAPPTRDEQRPLDGLCQHNPAAPSPAAVAYPDAPLGMRRGQQ